MEGAGTGLGKTAVVEGEPFVVVGVPAFNEEKTIVKVLCLRWTRMVFIGLLLNS